MRRLQDLRAARELVEYHGLERRSLGLHICQHAEEVRLGYDAGPLSTLICPRGIDWTGHSWSGTHTHIKEHDGKRQRRSSVSSRHSLTFHSLSRCMKQNHGCENDLLKIGNLIGVHCLGITSSRRPLGL